jgi:FtsH-binding integral membrane protein
VTHLVIVLLALLLIAVFAHHFGLSERAAFAIALIAVVLISILVPWKKQERR